MIDRAKIKAGLVASYNKTIRETPSNIDGIKYVLQAIAKGDPRPLKSTSDLMSIIRFLTNLAHRQTWMCAALHELLDEKKKK